MKTPPTDLLVLTKTTGWYGAHSGYYERVGAALAARPGTRLFAPLPLTPRRRLVGALHSRWLGQPVRDQAGSHAEWRLRIAMLRHPAARVLVLNLDDHLRFLRWWPAAPARFVGVLHLPPSCWSSAARRHLARLRSVVLPWRGALGEIEALVGPGRARFAPHGIDCSFFRPAEAPRERDHLLLCGQFLRDFERAGRLFTQLVSRRPGLKLSLVVPCHALDRPDLAWASTTPGVRVLSGLPDAELLRLYQSCTALLLPLLDSGANNTLMEALACGLPIATDDRGGVRDYGGESAFPLAPRGEDAALLEITARYLADPVFAAEVAQRQRALAETLDWPLAVAALLAVIEELAATEPDSRSRP